MNKFVLVAIIAAVTYLLGKAVPVYIEQAGQLHREQAARNFLLDNYRPSKPPLTNPAL